MLNTYLGRAETPSNRAKAVTNCLTAVNEREIMLYCGKPHTLLSRFDFWVPRRFQWYIAEGMLSLPTAKWSMVISFFSGVMASGFAFGCAKDTVEFFNAGIGEVRFPVGEGFLLVIFDYVGPWV